MGDTTSGNGQRGVRRRRSASAGSSVLTPPTGLPTVPDTVPETFTSTPQQAPVPQAPALEASVARQASVPPVALPPARPVIVEPCTCGHPKSAHEHYRLGRDCGACGAGSCPGFIAVGGPVRRLLRRAGLVD